MGSSPVLHCLLLVCWSVNLVLGAEQEFQRVSRDVHNQYRTKHHVNPLTASDDLNNRAQKCAQYYAEQGKIDHSCSDKNGAGENLWAQWGGSPTDSDAARSSSNSWYSEEKGYDYNKDYQKGKGHFTQMVWKNSREFGFGTGRKGNMIVGCALYSPAGNYIGQFKENVIRP